MIDIKTKRLVQLFWREQGTQQLIDVHSQNVAPERIIQCVQSDEFNQWLSSKRDFEPSKVRGRQWVKTCTKGHITELNFLADHRVKEYTLFNRDVVQGSWKVVDGQVEVELDTEQHTYRFAIIANRESSIHSAIEYCDNDLHGYLKIMQLEPIASP